MSKSNRRAFLGQLGSAAATFEGEFSGNVTSYAGKGVARYTW